MQELISNKTVDKLKYDLVREELISYENLTSAENESQLKNINLGQALIKLGFMDEKTLLKYIETKLHIPFVNLDDYSLDKRYLDLISAQEAQKYKLIPLFKIEDVLTVAMADPLDLFVLNNIIESLGCKIEPVICSEQSVIRTIQEHYLIRFDEHVDDNVTQLDWREELQNQNLEEQQIQYILYAIFEQAISENKQELYLEHSPYGLKVCFSSGSESVEKGNIPRLYIPLFLALVKKIANLDPYATQMPQHGRLEFLSEEKKYIVSVSSFPTSQGERITFKIFSPPVDFNQLSIRPERLEYLAKSLKSSGLIIVCGNKGSGKTSLAYSLLQKAAQEGKTVFTLESSIKYNLPKVHQCELQECVGFCLGKAMQHIGFQKPDVFYLEDSIDQGNADKLVSLVDNKITIISEFVACDINEVVQKIKEYGLNKILSCLVFINKQDNISVLDIADF